MNLKIIPIIAAAAILISSVFYFGSKTFGQNTITEKEITPISTELSVGLNIGNRAPELELASPDGKTIKLSSLKGQVVLIDFWASWCPPCRQENPNLVKSYEHFRNAEFNGGKGFTIYSVSLDKDRKGWIDAIKSDKLVWINHVSDLKGWESEAAGLYEVESIPSNFLIDGNGIILAKNLRGAALDATLNKLLK